MKEFVKYILEKFVTKFRYIKPNTMKMGKNKIFSRQNSIQS